MSSIADRWTWCPGDLVIIPAETDEERFAAFAEPFGELGDDRIFYDRGGHPVRVVSTWTEGLEHYAAAELKRAARAMADPDEIWQFWRKGRDGSRVWTRRYLRSDEGVDVCVQTSREGWCFATSEDAGFEREPLRHGELAWPHSKDRA